MRIIILIAFGLFCQTVAFAQVNQDELQKQLEEMQQQMQEHFKGFGFMFDGDSTIMKGFNFEDLQDLQHQFGDGNFMMPDDIDMQGMMELLERSMQGMNFQDIEQLLAPLMGELGGMMPMNPMIPAPEDLKEKEGEQEKQTIKKKKSGKKVYKL